MKSVFSKSSAGDSGLNVETPQKGRQRNDSLMQSLTNRTAGKLQCMGGGAAEKFYLGHLLRVALSTAFLVIKDSTPPNAAVELAEVQQDVSFSLCEWPSQEATCKQLCGKVDGLQRVLRSGP